MERAKEQRVEELKKQGKNVFSISRLNSLNQCPYAAYRTYKLDDRGDDNVWAALGSIMHDTLQDIIDNGTSTQRLREKLEDGIQNMEISGIDFPKSKNGDTTIRENWISNMMGFCQNFQVPDGKFETEQLVIYKHSDDDYVQGFIDLTRIDDEENKVISIFDWKTSSQFKGDHLTEAGRQLVLYAKAKEQEGYKINKLAWVMLKYCKVSWLQKNGKTKEKICEWRNYVEKIKPYLLSPPSPVDIDPLELELLVDKAVLFNSLDDLPLELKDQFKVEQYVRYYDYTPEVIEETLQYVDDQINSFKQRGDNVSNYPPLDISSNSFFCSSLCGHNKKCPYYKDYCSTFVKTNDNSDLF